MVIFDYLICFVAVATLAVIVRGAIAYLLYGDLEKAQRERQERHQAAADLHSTILAAIDPVCRPILDFINRLLGGNPR